MIIEDNLGLIQKAGFKYSQRLHAKRYQEVRNQSKILEINNFAELTPHVIHDSLLIFDLDNTIMEPLQLLGSDQWFEAHLAREIENGLDFSQALQNTLAIYNPVHHISKVKAVEENTVEIIKSFQNKGINILGLTTRGEEIAAATIRQLESIGLCFNKGKFENFSVKLNVGPKSTAQRGIIFAGGQHKGNCLLEYLSSLTVRPRNLIFVDDKLKNVLQVDEVAKLLGITYTGVRYGYLDHKIQNVDLNIADYQWHLLNTIASDEVVADVLQQSHDQDGYDYDMNSDSDHELANNSPRLRCN